MALDVSQSKQKTEVGGLAGVVVFIVINNRLCCWEAIYVSQTELFTDASFTSRLLPFANFLPRSLTLSRKLQCQATKSYRFLCCLTLLETFGTMLVHNSTQCTIDMLQIISLKSPYSNTGEKVITLFGNQNHSRCVSVEKSPKSERIRPLGIMNVC